MKKTIYTLILTLLALSLTAATLCVKERDGSITEYDAAQVERIYFKETPPEPTYKEMVLVKAGTFTMGEPDESVEDTDICRPVHSVTLTQDFYIGMYEVTQSIWAELMGSNPSSFTTDGANKPVETVSWYDCIEFCNALSARDGYDKVYNIDKLNTDLNNTNSSDDIKWTVTINANANGYRLPTESQWEYASKGGHLASAPYKIYSGSNDIDAVAWYYDNSDNTTHQGGIKASNELGIYDMSGNVWEWCFDWYDGYSSSSQTDPVGAVQGRTHVIRGGSYISRDGSFCRSASRNDYSADYRYNFIGLRLVRLP